MRNNFVKYMTKKTSYIPSKKNKNVLDPKICISSFKSKGYMVRRNGAGGTIEDRILG